MRGMLSQADIREQAHIGRAIAVAAQAGAVVEVALPADAQPLLARAARAAQPGDAAGVERAHLALLRGAGHARLVPAEPAVGARRVEAVAGLPRRAGDAGAHHAVV